MVEDSEDSFDKSRAETFEALGHPTRIRILQALSGKSLGFSELKRAVGIDSNGLLAFHLGKLGNLVKQSPDGFYVLTDEGREALRIIDASRNEGMPRLNHTLSFPRPKTVIASLLIVIIVLSSVVVIQQYQINGLNHSLDNLALHDQKALVFGASVSATTISQGQTVRVYLEEQNTINYKISVPLSNGLAALNLSSGPCGSLYPGGIAVYEGAYNLNNVSSATPLPFYASGIYATGGNYFLCGGVLTTNSFIFGPLQNLTTYFDLAGYYTPGSTPVAGGGVTEGVLHAFLPGIYTVIAGDPLGNTKVMYFHVTRTAGNLERSGPVSSFPASWLDPCNDSAVGNVTTGLYLDLNSTSALDHVNINQIYSQIVNSSSFIYSSVGHGWVVSEWFERGSSDNNATGGQVVASFILTSGGVPSGYLYVTYDLASATVFLSPATVQGTSCSG